MVVTWHFAQVDVCLDFDGSQLDQLIVCLVRLIPAMLAIRSREIRDVDCLDFRDEALRFDERFIMRGRSEGRPFCPAHLKSTPLRIAS